MRHAAAALLSLLLCACAAAPDEPEHTAAPLVTAKIALRDLRRADRALDRPDPVLGTFLPLKMQPPETELLQQALAERLGLQAGGPAAGVDLNEFDLWRRPDGVQTVRIGFILRHEGRASMHRVRKASAPNPGQTAPDRNLIRDALRELMETITLTSGQPATAP